MRRVSPLIGKEIANFRNSKPLSRARKSLTYRRERNWLGLLLVKTLLSSIFKTVASISAKCNATLRSQNHFAIRFQILERQLSSYFEESARSVFQELLSEIKWVQGLNYFFCAVLFSGLVSLLSIHLITFVRQRLWNVSQWITYATAVNIRCSIGTICDYYEYRNLECIMYVLLTVV